MNARSLLTSWLRDRSRSRTPIRNRPTTGRLGVEPLEDRLVPANTPATLLTGLRNTLDGVVDNLVSQAIQSAEATLPVINTKLRDLQTGVENAIDGVTNGIDRILTGQDPGAVQTRQNLTATLNPAAPDQAARDQAAAAITSALAPYAQNVRVTDLRPADGVAVVEMDLVAPLADYSFPLGTALPALPVQLGEATITLESDLRYEGLRVELQNDQFIFRANTGRTDELQLTLDAGLTKGAEFVGEIGFLKGTARVNDAGVGLHGKLVADVGQGLQVSDPRFAGLSAVADLRLTAEFATAGADSGIAMPKFRTDFRLDWDLSGARPNDPAASLGGTPRVAFKNVSVGLGTLLSNTIGPVVKTIQQLSAPIQPVLDLLAAPIPGLSDVGIGEVNLLKLAKLAQSAGTLPPHLQLITKIALEVAQLHTYVSRITIPGNEVFINLGDYDLTGSDGGTDLRQVAQKARTLSDLGRNPNLKLSDLKGLLVTAAKTLSQRIDEIRNQLPPEVQGLVSDWLTQTGFMNQLLGVGNGVKLSFPFIEDPVGGAVKILLGQPEGVKFVEFTADLIQVVPETELINFPVWGPVRGNATGSIDIELHFGVRYDAVGLRDFLAKQFHPNPSRRATDPALFARGLAFDSRNTNSLRHPNDLIHVTANIGAGAYLPFPVGAVVPGPLGFPVTAEVRVGSRGSLSGSLAVRLADPEGNGVIRPLYAPAGSRLQYLFEAEGKLDANIKLLVEAWFTGIKLFNLYERPLLEKTLFDTRDVDKSNPFRPPAQWSFGGTPAVSRFFDVRANGGRLSGPANDVVVRLNGGMIEVHVNGALRQSYPRVETAGLTVFGTRHDDNFVVRAIPLDVTVIGGGTNIGGVYVFSGHDTLTFDDRVPWLSPDMTYTVYADRVTTTVRDGQILYDTDFRHAAIDDIRLITPSRTNFVNVVSLPVVPFTIQTTPLYISPSSSWNRLATYDPHSIDSTFPSVNLITVNSSALDRDGASLTIDGRSGADIVTVRENLFTTYTYYTVGTDRVIREGSDGDFQPYRTGTVRFTGVDKLAVVDEWPGSLGRFYRVVGLDPATPVSITSGGGGDEFRLGGSLDALSSTDPFRVPYLTLAGGGGNDWLSLDDSLNTDASTVDESGVSVPTQVTSPRWWVNGPRIERTNTVQDLRLGTSATYRLAVEATGFETVSIAGSGGGDMFVVEATSAGQNLSITGRAGDDALTAGTFWVDGLHGPVTFDGGAGNDRLTVGDALAPAVTLVNEYAVRADRVTARGRTVWYAGVEGLGLTTGPGHDWVAVEGTPAGTSLGVHTGGGDDSVVVLTSGGPLSADLAGGNYQVVALGSAAHLLDAIHRDVRVAGAGFVDVFVSDAASTASHYVTVDSNFFTGQILERYHFEGEQWVTTHRFLFSFGGQSRLNHWTGRAGDVVFVNAVPAASSVAVYGQPGAQETFGVGFGADANRILGPVTISGQAADNDFAYYYDYLNPGPQTYDVRPAPHSDGGIVFHRSGAAPVTYHDLRQVIFYTPVVGRSTVNVQGVPAPTYLNMAVGNGDRVTFGSNAPNLGGTLDGIRGPVSIGPGGVGAAATLILDDSGNTATGRDATVTSADYQGIPLGTIEGLAPGALIFRDQDNWVVDVRGGAHDDRFRMTGRPLAARASIDGGGGVNTLDYSALTTAAPGLVSLWRGEDNALDSAGGNHGTAVNVAYADGKVGRAFEFTGQFHQYVEVGAALRPQTVTVEAWVNSLGAPSGRYIVAKGALHGTEASFALATGLDLNAPGGLIFYLSGSPSPIVSPDAGPGIWDGNWHHVAGVFDGTAVRLYVDGVEVGTGTPYSGSIRYGAENNPKLYIGAYDAASNYSSFVGKIDEVGIFDRALSAAEVARHAAGKSALDRGVAVNLRTGAATGLRGGVTNIRNVVGGSGDDLLVGSGGNVLDGRAGRDILIAGPAGAVPGLLARYTAADGDATDSAGNHHGTVHGGVTFGPGYRGQGFHFNGVDAYVRVPNAPDLEPATVTVEAWVRATAPGRNAYILSKGALGDTAASYAIYTGANAGLQFYIGGGGSFALSPDAGTAVWDGQWHHVAGTFDGATVRLFVDGVEVGTGSPTTLRIGYGLPNSNDLFIGSYNRGYLFNGGIDEVAVHGRALSAAEVVASFYNRLAGPPSGVLIGGDGDDLLIAGSTAYDLDPAALASIQAEWTRTDIDYATRVANLTTGNGGRVPRLTAETVPSNGGGNVLTGGAAADLFFVSIDLDLADNEEGESVVVI